MPAPAPTATLRSLAKSLGLSRTTVSDALRGSPRVDPRTAARVQQAAGEAGYRRNPLAGALMSELRRSRGSTFRGVLAVLEFSEPDRPANAAAYHRELAAGVNARATELGFRTERFVVGPAGVSVHRPDVVVGHHAEAIAWMRDCGARVPATHGFFCLNLHMQARPCAGLDLQPRMLGARSAELLIAQLHHNETGIPAGPSTTTIPALWTEGPTLRPAGGKSSEVRLRSKPNPRATDGYSVRSA